MKLHSANIAARFTSPRGGVLLHGRSLRLALCCDIWILGRLQGSFCSISQHTSSGGVGSPVQPGLSDKYCAAILPVLGLDSASRVRYRSTHPGRGARHGRELPSNLGCLTSSVLRYLVFRPPPGPVSANIAAQYSWSRISGASGARLPACSTRLGERRKATGGTCTSAVTANCARNSHYIMIGCNEN